MILVCACSAEKIGMTVSAAWMHRKISRGHAKCGRVCGVVRVDLCMWWRLL